MNQFKKYTATVLSLTLVLSLTACSSKEEPAAPAVSTPNYQAPSIPAATPVAPSVTVPEATVIPEIPEPSDTPEPSDAPETSDTADTSDAPETPDMGSDLEVADILTSATVDPNWTDEQKYEQYADRVLENIKELGDYLEDISDFEVMDESLYAHVETINGKIDRKVNKLYTNLENVPAQAQGIHMELVDAYDLFFTLYEESCITLIELSILSEIPEESLTEADTARMLTLIELMDAQIEPLEESMVQVDEANATLDATLLTYLSQETVEEIMEKYDLL